MQTVSRGPRGGIFYLNRFGNKTYLPQKYKLSSFGKKQKQIVKRTDEALWKRIVARVKKSNKGGRPGQWSARKAQLAVKLYKEAGGRYKGRRSPNNSLHRWTRQDWTTRSGRPSIQGPRARGERYLPRKAIQRLSKKEYQSTTRRKRQAIKKGKQFSRQPRSVSRKVKKYR